MWLRFLQQMLEAEHREIPELPLNRIVGKSSSYLFQVPVKFPLRRPFLSTRETRPKLRPLLQLSTSHKGKWSERFGRLQLNPWFVQRPCFLLNLVTLIFQGQVFHLLHESVHFLGIFYIEASCTDLRFTISQKALATFIVCKDLVFTEVRRQACEFLLFFYQKRCRQSQTLLFVLSQILTDQLLR